MSFYDDDRNKDFVEYAKGEVIGETMGKAFSLFSLIDTGYRNPILSIISKVVSVYCAFCLVIGDRGMTLKQKAIFWGVLFIANFPIAIQRYYRFKYRRLNRKIKIDYEMPYIQVNQYGNSGSNMIYLKYNGNIIGRIEIIARNHRYLYSVCEKSGDTFKGISGIGYLGERQNYKNDLDNEVLKFKEYVSKNRKDLLK